MTANAAWPQLSRESISGTESAESRASRSPWKKGTMRSARARGRYLLLILAALLPRDSDLVLNFLRLVGLVLKRSSSR